MTVFAMAPDGVRIALHELGDPDGAAGVRVVVVGLTGRRTRECGRGGDNGGRETTERRAGRG